MRPSFVEYGRGLTADATAAPIPATRFAGKDVAPQLAHRLGARRTTRLTGRLGVGLEELDGVAGKIIEEDLRSAGLTGACRIGNAPVGRGRCRRKLWADLAYLVEKRDDSVEATAGEAGERLRGSARDFDTTFGHHADRVVVKRFRVAASAPPLEGARRQVLHERFGDR